MPTTTSGSTIYSVSNVQYYTQNPGNATFFNFAGTIYHQRVYCADISQWCYYSGPLNKSPSSTITTPNWTGSISNHQILSTVTAK